MKTSSWGILFRNSRMKQKGIKKSPGQVFLSGTPKNGGDLLSQLVCQYHRRG